MDTMVFDIVTVTSVTWFCQHLAELAAEHPHGDVMRPRAPDELTNAVLLSSDTGLTLGAVRADGEMVATISLEHQGAKMVTEQIARGARWAITNKDNVRMTTLLRNAGWVIRFEVPRPPDGLELWPGANSHFPLLLWSEYGTTFEVSSDLQSAERVLREGCGALANVK